MPFGNELAFAVFCILVASSIIRRHFANILCLILIPLVVFIFQDSSALDIKQIAIHSENCDLDSLDSCNLYYTLIKILHVYTGITFINAASLLCVTTFFYLWTILKKFLADTNYEVSDILLTSLVYIYSFVYTTRSLLACLVCITALYLFAKNANIKTGLLFCITYVFSLKIHDLVVFFGFVPFLHIFYCNFKKYRSFIFPLLLILAPFLGNLFFDLTRNIETFDKVYEGYSVQNDFGAVYYYINYFNLIIVGLICYFRLKDPFIILFNQLAFLCALISFAFYNVSDVGGFRFAIICDAVVVLSVVRVSIFSASYLAFSRIFTAYKAALLILTSTIVVWL